MMSIPKILVFLALISINLQAQNPFVPVYIPKPHEVSEVSCPRINLNGSWGFNPKPDESFWKSLNPQKNPWNPILVPGEWCMQGFSVKPGTRAAYWRKIEIPEDWKNKRIILRCDALYSDAKVWINGKFAGAHQGGFTPAEFDLTGLAFAGKSNNLIIGLVSESLADTLASASQYAAHQLGGITRKIEIFTVPGIYFSKINLETDLDDQYRDADLNIDLEIKGLKDTGRNKAAVEVELNPLAENGTQSLKKLFPVEWNQATGIAQKKLNLRVRNPAKWDPEHPNLYRVTIRLVLNGVITETIVQKTGFREIMVAGNQLFINGHPIKLFGVNRHEVHPLKGRSLSMEEWKTDAQLFKEANVNYIRTSHYPPAEEFIALCDSIGLFVECESPLCWVGHGANTHWQIADSQDTSLLPLIRPIILETVAHYRNHPSIIIWSMANESLWGFIWSSMLRDLNKIDPTRPVSFHDQAYGGYNNAGSTACQIANMHYPGPSGPEIAARFDRPLLFGEYCHLNCYNRQEIVADPGVRDDWGRGLQPMVDNMYASPGCLGGAIWSGIDDAFLLPSGKLVGYGEWGPIDGWRRQKPEYWHLKKAYSPVRFFVNKIQLPKPGQPIRIPVQNRYLFTNLNEVTFRWKLGSQQGVATTWALPGATGILSINPTAPLSNGDELEITAISPQQFIVDKHSVLLGEILSNPVKVPVSSLNTELLIQGDLVSLQSGGYAMVLSARNGMVKEMVGPGLRFQVDGPFLQMLPLTTGPCNTEHSLDIQPLNHLCGQWEGKVTGTGTDTVGPWIRVEGSYEEAGIVLTYRMDSSGLIAIDYQIRLKSNLDPRQMGLVFSFPRSMEILSWDRIAQWTVYPEDHIGRTSGWTRPFGNGMHPISGPGTKPQWSWAEDQTPWGSNDFRATRERILWAELQDTIGQGIRIESGRAHAVRAWIQNEKIWLLVASFFTGGGDLFFASHHQKERMPLKSGDSWNGSVKMRVR